MSKEKIFKRLLNAFKSFLIEDLAKDHEISLRKGPLDLNECEIQKHVDGLKEEYKNSDELKENINSWLEDYQQAENDSEVETTERGWPGHFIAGDRCSFTRNTLVRYGDKKVVVSNCRQMVSQRFGRD